ncbi:hypoxanthine-guanine phosphoribosyltransferase, putative [Ixodes scapularis]|uniref:Hypoxanthine-guanine phosphoribosyltransferase, putative n=1 Tax=Ixodes scapularis TaxID=6945 RepID=B7Q6G1_IXOSC|nr:hypoxanthine-guanine phosphoribosyltransferase, putative [Ixodes scapularis]|eukprot:XP_002402956.1 hypoxanthine-guanine phosphoribosyltransferase, putative [Ixodes scapularis]
MSGDNYVSIPDNFQGYKLEHFCIPQHYKGDLESVFLPCGLVHDRSV